MRALKPSAKLQGQGRLLLLTNLYLIYYKGHVDQFRKGNFVTSNGHSLSTRTFHSTGSGTGRSLFESSRVLK